MGELRNEGGSLGERKSKKAEMDGVHKAGVNLGFSWRKNLLTEQCRAIVSVLPSH